MAQKKKDKISLAEEGKTVPVHTGLRGTTYKLMVKDMEMAFIDNEATYLRIAIKERLSSRKLL